MADPFGIQIKIDYNKGDIDTKLTEIQKYLDSKKLNLNLNFSEDVIKGLQEISKYAQSSFAQIDKLKSGLNAIGTKNGFLIFDKTQLDKEGQEYIQHYAKDLDTLEALIKKRYGNIQEISNLELFKNSKGDIESFIADIHKTNGEIEKLKYNFAYIQNKNRKSKGFVLDNSSLLQGDTPILPLTKKAINSAEEEKTYSLFKDRLNQITSDLKKNGAEISNIFESVNTKTGLVTKATVQYTDSLGKAKVQAYELKRTYDTIKDSEGNILGKQLKSVDLVPTTTNYTNNISKQQAENYSRIKQELNDIFNLTKQKLSLDGESSNAEKEINEQLKVHEATLKELLDTKIRISKEEETSAINAKQSADIDRIKQTNAKELSMITAKSSDEQIAKAKKEADDVVNFQRKMQDQIRGLQVGNNKIFSRPAIQTELSALTAELAKMGTVGAKSEAELNSMFSNLRSSVRETASQISLVNRQADGFSTTLIKDFGKMAAWSAVATAMYAPIRSLESGIKTVNELNKSMTNIQMITGVSSEKVQQMTKNYSDLASTLHETTTEVMKGAEEFLRAGNTAEETSKLLQASTVMSKIAGQSQQEASDGLISIMNAYHMSADDMMGVVDKLVAIDNTSATSTKELNEAIQKSAATAQSAGVTFDQLASWIGVVSSVTRQSASTIGAGFNSIFARFQSIKEGKNFDPDGNPLNNVEKALNRVGIAMRSDSNTFRSFNEIIKDISDNWSKYNDVQKNEIATAIAGTYQRNKFLSLMTNMDKALELQTTEADSAGNAMKRYGTYGESTEAKLNDLKNTLQRLWMNLIHSDTINEAITLTTHFVETIGRVVPALGGWNIALIAIVASALKFSSALKAANIATQGLNWTSFATNIGKATASMIGLVDAEKAATFATIKFNAIAMGIPLLIGGIVLLYENWINKQQILKEKTDAVTQSQQDFDKALIAVNKDANNSSGLDQMAKTLDELHKSTYNRIGDLGNIDYDATVKKIDELTQRIETIKANLGNDSGQSEATLLPSLEKQKAELEYTISAIDNVTNSQKAYDNELTTYSNNMAIAIAAVTEYNKNGKFTDETVNKLTSAYPKLNGYIEDQGSLYQQLMEITSQEAENAKQAVLDKLSYNEQFYSDSISRHSKLVETFSNDYNIDLSHYKTLAEAKAAVDQELIQNLAGAWASYYDATTGNFTGRYVNYSGETISSEEAQAEIDAGYSVYSVDQNGNQMQVTGEGMQWLWGIQQKATDAINKLNSLASGGGIGGLSSPPDISSSSFIPEGGDSSKSSSPKPQEPNTKDATEEIIRASRAEAELVKLQDESLQKQIEQANSAEDYSKALSLTNQLMAGQQTQIDKINASTKEIQWEYNHQLDNYSQFDQAWSWIDQNGDSTIKYVQAYNSASADTQKQMEELFDKISKLRKAWAENDKSVQDLNDSMVTTLKTIKDLQDSLDKLHLDKISKDYTDMTDGFKTKLANLDLLDSFIDPNDLEAKTKAIKDKMELTLSEIVSIQDKIKSIESMDISKTQKEDLFKQWSQDLSEALTSYQSLEQSLASNAQAKLDVIKSVEQTIIAMIKQGYQDELNKENEVHDQKIKNLDEEKKAYDEIIQAKIDSLDQEKEANDYNEKLNNLQNERNNLQAQYDALIMDNSSSAEAQRNELQQAITAKDKEIQDSIYEHGLDYRKKNLEDSKDTFEKQKDAEIDSENKVYEEFKKIMEQKMSDQNLYFEARNRLSNESTTSLIADLTAYTDKFGEGMSLLGDSIKENLIDNLKLAVSELGNIPALLDEINSGNNSNSTVDSATDTVTNPPEYTNNRRVVYGNAIDLENAKEVLGTDKFQYVLDTSPDPSKVTSRDIIVGGYGAISNWDELRKIDGLTFLYGDDRDATKQAIINWKSINGYSKGGVNTTTGLAQLHGTPSDPEVIFNSTDASKLFNFVKSLSLPHSIMDFMPRLNLPSFSSSPNTTIGDVKIELNVAGNLDKTVLPEVKTALSNTAQTLRKELNKLGIYKKG